MATAVALVRSYQKFSLPWQTQAVLNPISFLMGFRKVGLGYMNDGNIIFFSNTPTWTA